jgi:glucosamine-6-phosphate deaminase
MRIVLAKSTEAAVDTVVTIFLDRLSVRPASVFGLATGKTMIPLYKEWVARGKQIDHAKAFFFMLDEYQDMDHSHAASFHSYIENNFRGPLGLGSDQFAFPTPDYEAEIRQASGIDVQLLGLGTNGHIAFNEPGSLRDSRTRVVNLTAETIKNNQISVTQAMTMGIATILESKEIVLLATGFSKADAIKYLINHHDDPSCPVTFLKSHPRFTLVLDPAAASKINLKI